MNYPLAKKDIPKMQRDKDLKANVKFLENVIDTMKLKRDPIEALSKHIGTMVKQQNEDLNEEEDEEEQELSEDSDHDVSIHNKAKKGMSGLTSFINSESVENGIHGRQQLRDKKIRDYQWIETNPNPQMYQEEQKRFTDKIEMLNRKLKKYTANRNISFNLKVVFRVWKEKTEEYRTEAEQKIKTIGEMRKFIATFAEKDGNVMSKDSGATNSEGKTTDEAQEIHQNEGVVIISTKDQKSQRFGHGDNEDQDQDISKPNENTSKLIPNCFGVYKPN